MGALPLRPQGIPIDGSLEHLTYGIRGPVTVQTGVSGIPIHGGTFQIVSIGAHVNTAPTGAAIILDVKKNGTSIYNVTPANKPTIAISGNNATVAGPPDTTSLTSGDALTVDVGQVGSTIAGADLVLSVRIQRIS